MFYQWGHKDPFTFATNSQIWGTDPLRQYGKYPVKIYTIDGVLIYQESNGSSNKDKQPVGGVISSSALATSMMEVVKDPSTFYGASPYTVINQVGHTKSLWDYYWTSYSRGTDGKSFPQILTWHNVYLDGYLSSRSKSIYDPCPYGFRVPSNGTYNDFKLNIGWVHTSYAGGITWDNGIQSWFHGLGRREPNLVYVGAHGFFTSSILGNSYSSYNITIIVNQVLWNSVLYGANCGHSVRCIEEMTIVNIQKFAQSKFLFIV